MKSGRGGPRAFRRRLPERRSPLLALRPNRLPRALDSVHQRLADRPAGARGVVTTLGSYSRTMDPGFGISWPYPFGGHQTRRRGDPYHPDSRQRRESDPHRRPERHRPRLFGAWNIKDPEKFAFQSPIRSHDQRGRRKRDARGVLAGLARRRDRRRPRRHRPAGPAEHAASTFGSGVEVQGSRSTSRGCPRGSTTPSSKFPRRSSARRADQQCPLLCAPAHRPGPGRGGGVREGHGRVSPRPAVPVAPVLRDNGARPAACRYDDRQGAWDQRSPIWLVPEMPSAAACGARGGGAGGGSGVGGEGRGAGGGDCAGAPSERASRQSARRWISGRAR